MHGDKYIPRIMNNTQHRIATKPRASRERAICMVIKEKVILVLI